MKTTFSLVLLCLPLFCFTQIHFEQLESPADFSIQNIRKSPTGEYFTQSTVDQQSIYSSLDGVTWTEAQLPNTNRLGEMQFFSDGTPMLKGEREEHMVRRNGIWYDFPFGSQEVESSFIKDDSLFIFHNQTFSYSLDKGETFNTAFSINTFYHTSSIWKFNNHYILHHTVGASDNLSVFDQQGTSVFSTPLNGGLLDFVFNECGELLILDNDEYYLLQENGLSFTSGNTENIIPNFSYSQNVYSQSNNYYTREDNVIYKSPGCGFDWQPLITDDLIDANTNYYYFVDPLENIFLYSYLESSFLERSAGTNTFTENPIDIIHPYVFNVDESTPGEQVVLTPGNLFTKEITNSGWTPLSLALPNQGSQIEYAPNGDLYVNTGTDILHSTDNGVTFNTIEYPDVGFPDIFYFRVIDDDFLFASADFNGSFYSLNNGLDWIMINSSFPFINPNDQIFYVKHVNNSILIAELYDYFDVLEINLSTNEETITSIGDFFGFDVYAQTMLDDGTIYFYMDDFTGQNPTGLHRFKVGEGTTFLGEFPEIAYTRFISTSADDLFAIGYDDNYFRFDGNSFTEFPMTGLPNNGFQNYFLSENEHLYVIAGSSEIYRSTQPLAEKQYISGSVFHDANSDCLEDPADAKLQYWSLEVEGDNFYRMKTSNLDGDYKFAVPIGDYTISAQAIDENWDLCETSFDLSVNAPNEEVVQNFNALPLTDCAALSVDFSTPRLRRCFDNYYTVRVRNTGPQVSNATSLTLDLDPFFDYSSASIPLTQVNDSTLQVDLGQLGVNEQITFNIYFTLSCDAELSQTHCLSGTLTDANICPSENTDFTECQENIGSFDPNDKRTFNALGQETSSVDKDEYIYYHIRFQNTGTDTAFTVRVEDPLSPILDLSTLEMLSASHAYSYSVTDGPELVVLFENILLPDSTTNEVASNGFFKFKIKPLPSYDYGTVIPNQAAIFFDFNEPVITNESILEILLPTNIHEKELLDFSISPNPAHDFIALSIDKNDLSRVSAFEIVNQLGQVVFYQKNDFGELVFDVSNLESGVYNLVLREEEKRIGVKRFVRM